MNSSHFVKLYKRGDFVLQLENVYPPLLNKKKNFIFPLIGCQMSIQAGVDMKSRFIIDGKTLSYPFYFDFSSTEVSNLLLNRNNDNKLPLNCCTHFEVGLINSKKSNYLCSWYTPEDFHIEINDDNDWEENGPGNFIDKNTVQKIIDSLADLEDEKIHEKKILSAIQIQAAFRSWRVRKNVIWNLNTELGRGFLKLKIANDMKNDV